MSTLKDTLDALRGLSAGELRSVQSRCTYLIGTKRREETREQEMVTLIKEHQGEDGTGDGKEWQQPINPLDGYLRDVRVFHKDQRWRSKLNGNVWEPGVAGWRLDPEDGVPPPYRQPTGADPYEKGERITWTDGEVYEAVRNGVVHSPSEYPDDWQLIEDSGDDDPDEDEGTEPEEPTDPEEPEPGDEDEEPTEPEEPEPEPSLPEWKTDVDYQPGDRFTYQGHEYTVLQAHTSAAHWPPDQVASLYERQG